jgi:isopenicillin-N N-acyltransferase like protein
MGEAGRDTIPAAVDGAFADDLPSTRSREEQLRLAAGFRAFTEPRLPWLIERLDACAEAAGVDPLAFFATTVEELWYDPRTPLTQGRCSDLVAGPAATADGHLLVGHTNDLRPEAEDELAALEIAVDGDPAVLQLGGIPWLSVGWNDAGLSLTGNELSPNDERVGISRSHQVLEMIRARTLDAMVAASLRPDRASSYNNVLASADGEVVNVEGSATDAELTGLDPDAHLAHTNHYACDRMLPFEGDPGYAVRSGRRLARARELLHAQPPGSITPESMRTMLSDHAGRPDAICRHPDADHPDVKTVFWCVADLTEGRVTFGRGNPCDSEAQEYVFASWPGR